MDNLENLLGGEASPTKALDELLAKGASAEAEERPAPLPFQPPPTLEERPIATRRREGPTPISKETWVQTVGIMAAQLVAVDPGEDTHEDKMARDTFRSDPGPKAKRAVEYAEKILRHVAEKCEPPVQW